MPYSNHTQTIDARKPIHIWIIHDNKPGHLSQLQGLSQRLNVHANTNVRWIDSKNINAPVKGIFGTALKGRNDLGPDTEVGPDIVIGAGHGTHRSLLRLAKQYAAISVVVMKPSLPLRMFDFVICPKHDGIEENEHTLTTDGAINKIEPCKTNPEDRQNNLILLGGPSKHYEWDDELLLREIDTICSTFPDRQWLLSSSPRTPDTFISNVAELTVQNLEIHDYRNGSPLDLASNLKHSRQAWVTPDSVSMLYESLTSRCQTSIFSLEPNSRIRPGKVVRQVQKLVHDKNIGDIRMLLEKRMSELVPSTLWEAERAALWLLKKYTHLRASGNAIN